MKTRLLLLSAAVALAALAPTAQAYATPPTASAVAAPDCMDIYNRWDAGTVSVVQRSSCDYEVYQCPSPGADLSTCRNLLVMESTAAASGPDCYMVYTRTDVGQLTVIRRTSCSVPEFYWCPYQGAPLYQCEPLVGLEASTASSQEPMCMYYYFEYSVGPVTYVQRDSCHSETYLCGENVKEVAVTEADPVALAQCTVDSLGVLA